LRFDIRPNDTREDGPRDMEKDTPESPNFLERLSALASAATGSSGAFATAAAVVLVWAATGPLFRFSDTWQLVINTGTTIVTFLMVFLIQRNQNKDSRALHLKLNEVVAALDGASNRLIDAEDLTEAQLERLHERYSQLASLTRRDESSTRPHSVEEATRAPLP
jgi:low affinity Fe/Cu permease